VGHSVQNPFLVTKFSYQPYRYKYDNVAKCDTRAPPNTQYASGITTHVGTRTYSKGNDRTHW
jgi:hypothetical protein